MPGHDPERLQEAREVVKSRFLLPSVGGLVDQHLLLDICTNSVEVLERYPLEEGVVDAGHEQWRAFDAIGAWLRSERGSAPAWAEASEGRSAPTSSARRRMLHGYASRSLG